MHISRDSNFSSRNGKSGPFLVEKNPRNREKHGKIVVSKNYPILSFFVTFVINYFLFVWNGNLFLREIVCKCYDTAKLSNDRKGKYFLWNHFKARLLIAFTYRFHLTNFTWNHSLESMYVFVMTNFLWNHFIHYVHTCMYTHGH